MAKGCCALSAAALSACGCKSADVGKPSSSNRNIDIVMTLGTSGLVIHELAKSQGYFDQFHIAPNPLFVSDGGKCVAALVSGAAKMCIFSGFNQLTPAIEKGADLKILAGALNLPSLALFSSNPQLKSVTQLEGKSIGIGSIGSVVHMMTVLLLRKKGVNPDKVNFRNVGSSADIFKAVLAKTVDAGLADVALMGEQAKFGVHVIPDGLLWKEIPEFTNQGSYTTANSIKENRDAIVRVLAAYAKAYRFVSSPVSQDAFVKARAKVTGVNDEQEAMTEWHWIQSSQPYALDLVLSNDRINFVQQVNVEFKNQTRILPAASITDMSLAADAIKLLDKS